MILALILLFSLAPGVYVIWRVSGEQAWRSLEREKANYPSLTRGKSEPTAGNYGVGVFLGFLSLFIWPFFVVLWIGGKDLAGTHRLLYVPPEHRRARYEERIRELEREVGIR